MTAYLTPKEAAMFLRLAPQTLANKRHNGSGPAFSKVGTRVLYRRADLLIWAKRYRVENTQQVGRG